MDWQASPLQQSRAKKTAGRNGQGSEGGGRRKGRREKGREEEEEEEEEKEKKKKKREKSPPIPKDLNKRLPPLCPPQRKQTSPTNLVRGEGRRNKEREKGGTQMEKKKKNKKKTKSKKRKKKQTQDTHTEKRNTRGGKRDRHHPFPHILICIMPCASALCVNGWRHRQTVIQVAVATCMPARARRLKGWTDTDDPAVAPRAARRRDGTNTVNVRNQRCRQNNKERRGKEKMEGDALKKSA
jgi:hypothetical protein